jgi:hypothetical protein
MLLIEKLPYIHFLTHHIDITTMMYVYITTLNRSNRIRDTVDFLIKSKNIV